MSQKYDKIAKTLEYLIHKYFLFKKMTQMPCFHENCRTAGSTVLTASAITYIICQCGVLLAHILVADIILCVLRQWSFNLISKYALWQKSSNLTQIWRRYENSLFLNKYFNEAQLEQKYYIWIYIKMYVGDNLADIWSTSPPSEQKRKGGYNSQNVSVNLKPAHAIPQGGGNYY